MCATFFELWVLKVSNNKSDLQVRYRSLISLFVPFDDIHDFLELLIFHYETISGVETGSSGRFNEPGHRSPGGHEDGAKKFYASKEYATWRWRLTPLSRPGGRPSCPKAPPPLSALRASSFSPWGQAEGIVVTVEPGPLRALLRHWKLCLYPVPFYRYNLYPKIQKDHVTITTLGWPHRCKSINYRVCAWKLLRISEYKCAICACPVRDFYEILLVCWHFYDQFRGFA